MSSTWSINHIGTNQLPASWKMRQWLGFFSCEIKVWMLYEHARYICQCVTCENTEAFCTSYILSNIMNTWGFAHWSSRLRAIKEKNRKSFLRWSPEKNEIIPVEISSTYYLHSLGVSALTIFLLHVLSTSLLTLWAVKAVGPLWKSLLRFTNHVDRQLPN